MVRARRLGARKPRQTHRRTRCGGLPAADMTDQHCVWRGRAGLPCGAGVSPLRQGDQLGLGPRPELLKGTVDILKTISDSFEGAVFAQELKAPDLLRVPHGHDLSQVPGECN